MAALYAGVTNRNNRNWLLRLEKNRWQQQDSENVKIDSLFRQEFELLALSSFVCKVDRKL